MPKSENSRKTSLQPLTPSQLRVAKENLVACLEAYDRDGDAGLEKELLRMYPENPTQPEFREKRILKSSHILIMNDLSPKV